MRIRDKRRIANRPDDTAFLLQVERLVREWAGRESHGVYRFSVCVSDGGDESYEDLPSVGDAITAAAAFGGAWRATEIDVTTTAGGPTLSLSLRSGWRPAVLEVVGDDLLVPGLVDRIRKCAATPTMGSRVGVWFTTWGLPQAATLFVTVVSGVAVALINSHLGI